MWPSAFCKAIHGPEAILDGEPGEETALWGCPSLPVWGFNSYDFSKKKLHVIKRACFYFEGI
jgi:hypothetical protein